MKVTPSNNPELTTSKKIDKQSAGYDLDAPTVDGLMPDST